MVLDRDGNWCNGGEWMQPETKSAKKRRKRSEKVAQRQTWHFGGGQGGKAGTDWGRGQNGGWGGHQAGSGGQGGRTAAQGGGGGGGTKGGKQQQTQSWGGGGGKADAHGGQGGGKAQGGKGKSGMAQGGKSQDGMAQGGKAQAVAQGGPDQNGTGKGGSHGKDDYRPRHWETPDGVHVKCENVDCARASQLASQAGWECPGCNSPYLWGKFWRELCEARMSPDSQATEGKADSAMGEVAVEVAKARYTGGWRELMDDNEDSDVEGDPPKPPDKDKRAACQYKAPEADAADHAAKAAHDAWMEVHESFKKKRKQFQVSQGKLQSLLLQVQKQLDWMDVQKDEVADVHAEVEAAAANFCAKESIQKAACTASVNKIADTMASARSQATAARARYGDEKAADDGKAGKEIERLKREAKEARVRRVKQEEQTSVKAAAAEASANEARKENEAQERRRVEEREANDALEKAVGKAGDGDASTSGSSAAGACDEGGSSGSAATVGAPGTAAPAAATEPEVPAVATAATSIEVSHEDAGRWKEAMVHWIWDASPEDEVPEVLLQWTHVGGDDDAANAQGFADGAKAARDALASKREAYMASAEQVRRLSAAGAEEGARQLAWDTEAYGSELRSSFRSWMDTELNARLGELLQKRKEAVDAGTAVHADAFMFSTAPKKRGPRKARRTGAQLVCDVAGTKDVAKGDKFCKRSKKDPSKEGGKDDESE